MRQRRAPCARHRGWVETVARTVFAQQPDMARVGCSGCWIRRRSWFLRKWMAEVAVGLRFGAKPLPVNRRSKMSRSYPGGLPAAARRCRRGTERNGQSRQRRTKSGTMIHRDKQHEEQHDARADAAHEPPEQTSFQSPRLAFGVGRGVGIGEAEICFHFGSGRRVAGMCGGFWKIRNCRRRRRCSRQCRRFCRRRTRPRALPR